MGDRAGAAVDEVVRDQPAHPALPAHGEPAEFCQVLDAATPAVTV